MNTDALIKTIAIPFGVVLLFGIALTTKEVQIVIGGLYDKLDNSFETDPHFQQIRERNSDSDYKSARSSFTQGGKSKSKSKKVNQKQKNVKRILKFLYNGRMYDMFRRKRKFCCFFL
jgi:hypothetical protein